MSALKNSNYYIHGLSHTRIDHIYKNMISRCYYPNNNRYELYGGRGIFVCSDWVNDKRCFFEWAFNNGYSDNLTLDRIDSDKGYSPDNCRWSTQKEQQNNRRNTIRISLNGVERTISEWSEITGIKQKTIWSRYSKGWSSERILGMSDVICR